MRKELLKKIFVAIAYCAYVASTIMQNHLHIDLTFYNYIFVAIIGVSLTLVRHMDVVEKIIYTMPQHDLEIIKERLNSIIEQSQQGSITQRSTTIEMPQLVNEPITPSDIESTHRDFELSNGNIVRIHKK